MPILLELVFAALYFALKSRGALFWRKPNLDVLRLDPMAIEIKPAPVEFGDWEALMALLHAAFAFQHSRIDPPSSLHRFDAASIAVKAKEENLFLALDEGELVGCIFARPQAGVLYVGKMAVSPGRQGRGIGRRLMQAAEDLARKSGLGVLELETRVELTENHAAFAAMGFVKFAESSHPRYDRATALTMRKQLTTIPLGPNPGKRILLTILAYLVLPVLGARAVWRHFGV